MCISHHQLSKSHAGQVVPNLVFSDIKGRYSFLNFRDKFWGYTVVAESEGNLNPSICLFWNVIFIVFYVLDFLIVQDILITELSGITLDMAPLLIAKNGVHDAAEFTGVVSGWVTLSVCHCKCKLGKINAAANHWSLLCSYYSLTVRVKTVAMNQIVPPSGFWKLLSLTKIGLLRTRLLQVPTQHTEKQENTSQSRVHEFFSSRTSSPQRSSAVYSTGWSHLRANLIDGWPQAKHNWWTWKVPALPTQAGFFIDGL